MNDEELIKLAALRLKQCPAWEAIQALREIAHENGLDPSKINHLQNRTSIAAGRFTVGDIVKVYAKHPDYGDEQGMIWTTSGNMYEVKLNWGGSAMFPQEELCKLG
jgi:hypothetical protein